MTNGTYVLAVADSGDVALGIVLVLLLATFAYFFLRDGDEIPDVCEDDRPRLAVVETVTERELASRLVGLKGTPGLSAVEALLDNETKELLEAAMEEGATEAKLRERLGGAAALTQFKALLSERISEAVRTRDEEQEARDKEMAGKHE